MALITTPGAADADAYVSVAEFKAHCDARGISYAGLTDTVIEQRLRTGADYLVSTYRTRWAGTRASTTQALDWPRYDVPVIDAPLVDNQPLYYAPTEIPTGVKRANIEAALRAEDDLIPDTTQAVKREKVGQIEVEYQDGTSAANTYPAIDRLLAPFLVAPGGVRLFRG